MFCYPHACHTDMPHAKKNNITPTPNIILLTANLAASDTIPDITTNRKTDKINNIKVAKS
jgi:hypothetical protein